MTLMTQMKGMLSHLHPLNWNLPRPPSAPALQVNVFNLLIVISCAYVGPEFKNYPSPPPKKKKKKKDKISLYKSKKIMCVFTKKSR